MSDYYDVAQICMNGHVINSTAKGYPEHNTKFCKKCGAATITNCVKCKSEILGYFHMDGVASFEEFIAPSFCHNCGQAYPWTEIKIKAAKEYAMEIENITETEKQVLTESINELIEDSPRTTLAASRFKKIMTKAGLGVGNAFRDILVDIVSETAKKMIWP